MNNNLLDELNLQQNCKKKFNTNGWIDNNIIYLNGDNRENVKQLLINKYNYED
jgi:translation initiation factor 1 (eIF-1/SUI1)